MGFAEYIQIARRYKLTAKGGANDNVSVILESGCPYRHYIAWLHVLSATPDINIQPKFAEENDGAVVNVTSKGATIVFKIPTEEIRPATRGLHTSPNDISLPFMLKSRLDITNEDLANPIEFSVYMLATATPGGA